MHKTSNDTHQAVVLEASSLPTSPEINLPSTPQSQEQESPIAKELELNLAHELFGPSIGTAITIEDTINLGDGQKQLLDEQMKRTSILLDIQLNAEATSEIGPLESGSQTSPMAISERTTVVNPHRQEALEFARLYDQILDSALKGDPQALHDHLNALGEIIGNDYANRVRQGLAKNHAHLSAHRGEEIEYLFGEIFDSDNLPTSTRKEILGQLSAARYIEPLDGISIIEVDSLTFNLLKEHGVVPDQGGAVHFGSLDEESASFIVVRRSQVSDDFRSSDQLIADHTLRHELHHYLWNFSERSKTESDILEANAAQNMAFKKFRNEVAAYLVENRLMREEQPAEVLTYYSSQPDELRGFRQEVIDNALDTQNYLRAALALCDSQGIDQKIFIGVVLQARNYQELIAGVSAVIEDLPISANTLSLALRLCRKADGLSGAFLDILRQNGEIAQAEFDSFIKESLAPLVGAPLTELDTRLKSLETLSQELTLPFDSIVVGDGFVREHTKFNTDQLRNIPETFRKNITLDSDTSTFLKNSLKLKELESIEALRYVMNPEMEKSLRTNFNNLINQSYEEIAKFINPRGHPQRFADIDKNAESLWQIISQGEPMPALPARPSPERIIELQNNQNSSPPPPPRRPPPLSRN